MTGTTNPDTRWRWLVCGLLLLATTINYMDRQTLANLAVRVTAAFQLTEEQYGTLEMAFGWAFAGGSLLFGILVDRYNVRWLYPAALSGWSLAGVATGLVRNYDELLACRIALGFFEAGHWPCALATIQRLLSREHRPFGNSVLQSGASIGAILTPPVVLALLHWADNSTNEIASQASWRIPFVVVGLAGMFWVVGWFSLIRSRDLRVPDRHENERSSWVTLLWDRRIFALLVMVTCLNLTWQLIRAWLPKFLQQGRGYSESEALLFNSAYYIATDVGCLAAGAAALWLCRRGVSVHTSRILVYAGCAILTSCTLLAAQLPAGWLLLGTLLVIGAGALGMFPCYYSFTQEFSANHIGKVTGFLAAAAWFISSPFQRWYGWLIDRTGSFDLGLALSGLPPLLALGVFVLLWPRSRDEFPHSGESQ